ncbi:Uncharacterised protein [Mycobacteroides abscessus]|nr:Uncharacterised protein [Mycobacteroides abscessus]
MNQYQRVETNRRIPVGEQRLEQRRPQGARRDHPPRQQRHVVIECGDRRPDIGAPGLLNPLVGTRPNGGFGHFDRHPRPCLRVAIENHCGSLQATWISC